MRMLITGGSGFIGSNFINHIIDNPEVDFLVNLDYLTYSSNVSYNESVYTNPKYYQELGLSIHNEEEVTRILSVYDIDTVVNFAAETHVDNSIKNPEEFVVTNVIGTYNLLQRCKEYWNDDYTNKKFVHISSDEVFGSIPNLEDKFDLNTPYRPNSPYSSTKAASDLICRSYNKTYNFPVNVTNCCNNYGPHQHNEKLIPLVISKLKNRESIPVYGTGKNVREWIFVTDHCEAVWQVLKHGVNGQQYLIGSGFEMSNIDLVGMICDIFDEITENINSRSLITFVADRPGHDFRYSIDSSKIEEDLKWKASVDFQNGLRSTIEWYLKR